MTPQEEQEKARWWQRIVFLEPELARSEKARSRIEAVLGLYLGHRANIQKRRSKSPWELNHADAAEMKTRVEQLRRELQPYLPHERTMSPLSQKVRQTVADMEVVADYLGRLGAGAEEMAQKGRKREFLLQWLVAKLGKIRQDITGQQLDWGGGTDRYINACCAGLGEKDTTITNAKTYVLKHPSKVPEEVMFDIHPPYRIEE